MNGSQNGGAVMHTSVSHKRVRWLDLIEERSHEHGYYALITPTQHLVFPTRHHARKYAHETFHERVEYAGLNNRCDTWTIAGHSDKLITYVSLCV